MRSSHIRTAPRALLVPIALLLVGLPLPPAVAQDVEPTTPLATPAITACYDPTVGALYLIKLPGLAQKCLKGSHQEIVLRQGGDSAGAFTPPTGPAGGDLSGSYPNPVVAKLQSVPVAATVPTNGQVLAFTGGNWKPFTAAFNGDVTGTVFTTKVVKLQNFALAPTAPTNGQVLTWDATTTTWKPLAPTSGVTAHNQLSGLAGDDHQQYLLGDGVRNTNNGFAVTGTYAAGTIPASGTGVRLMWYPGKGAFRAGGVANTEWDDANIGVFSVALGGQTIASGAASTAMGGLSSATGTVSTALGASTANGDFATAMGQGVIASGTASTAIGSAASTNLQAGSFVYGDATTTTILNASVANEFAVRASGGLRFRTASDLSTGCDLPANSGVWSCTSSKLVKTDFADLAGEALLSKLRAVPVQTWRYRSEHGVRHMGPYAEDFRAAFGFGTDDRSIGLLDVAGVSLGGVKALDARTRELRYELAARNAEITQLRTDVEALLRRLAKLEQHTKR